MIKNFGKILELLGDRLEVCVSVCFCFVLSCTLLIGGNKEILLLLLVVVVVVKKILDRS